LEADVLVIGCGPAGLQAAIHASRAKVRTVVVGKAEGSAIHGIEMENYLGFTDVVDGTSFLEVGRHQAESFGAVFVPSNILSAEPCEGGFRIVVESGEEIITKSVVLATGVSRIKLGVPGEKELFGKGVSYCAICDCNFYRGRIVTIIGSQSEAAVSAEFMTRYASKTYWVAPEPDVDRSLIDAALSAGVEMFASPVREIRGEGKVSSVVLEDGTEISTDGAFIELGGRSSADIAMDLGIMPELDDSVKVSRDCSTSVPGVFACGDITGKPWQVAKAVGEGACAGLSASAFARKVSE